MLRVMTHRFITMLALSALATPAAAQDIRGLEVCTAEKTMERRTGCLQSNIDFLQQTLAKQAREAQDKLTAASRELTALKGDLAVLRAALAKLELELAGLKKEKPDKK